MEDMARLALVEESVRDIDKYQKILYELLRHINNILENPHDYQLRTIKSNILKEVSKFDSFNDYLKYVGFELVNPELAVISPNDLALLFNGEMLPASWERCRFATIWMTGDNFVYPSQSTLSNLRMAQGAIERKINFCFGSVDNNKSKLKTDLNQPTVPRINILPTNVLTTSNRFLRKIQDLFNAMLVYEDPELHALAREQIPIVTLQLMALDRVREQQMQIKTGKTKAQDLPFDIALLMELISWFKHEFFSWVDQPPCESCGASTTFSRAETMTTATETCRVEVFKCMQCGGGARFPRYNDVRTLLRTRRGRCGEWANCFTLLCRALGYDTRYVYDTTDHVWCEVFDFDSNTWLHCDPCEAKLNTPLMYCHGWGKKLSYVIAVSRDDLQDVTWRYTTDHKEVLKRRRECTESELIDAIVLMRGARQKHVSEPRRRYLAKRTLQELVRLMKERSPSDYECHGRISGSATWRELRGETGAKQHTFLLAGPGTYAIRYHGGTDKYVVTRDHHEEDSTTVEGWQNGVFHSKNMMRKVEHDWRKVYLARTEGESEGSVSWRVSCGAGTRGAAAAVRLGAARYHGALLTATVGFDSRPPLHIPLEETGTHFNEPFTTMSINVELSGGEGEVAWQHAQLARQSLDNNLPVFEILATVEPSQEQEL